MIFYSKLKKDLVETSKYGRNPVQIIATYEDLDPRKGVTRPTGSEANKKIRNYTIHRMKQAGLEVKIDKIGNIFGKKQGSNKGQKSVMCGSHLDSVINGGMFDGALGVFAAIEAVRRIRKEKFQHEKPIEIVVFTAEEGSAFGMAPLGSTSLIGKLSLEEALSRTNEKGIKLLDILERIGYAGRYQRKLDDVEYFVEMHIEQGPVLFNKGITIGIVENIVGIAGIIVNVYGEANHAGTTSMNLRKDPLLASAEIIQFVNKRAIDIANEKKSSIVATVGKMDIFPNATNVIPSRVELVIDIRDVVYENLKLFQNNIIKKIKSLEEKYHVNTVVDLLPIELPAQMSQEVIQTIEESSSELNIDFLRMNSFAGHDAQNMAEVVKTGMIFVPSVNGISHAPLEWTEWGDIEKGVKVLTETIKRLSYR